MADLGLIDSEQNTLAGADTPVGSLTEQREDMAYRMAVYAAVIHETDAHIGRLVDRLGRRENTTIHHRHYWRQRRQPQDYNYYASKHGTIEGWHEQAYPLVNEKESYGHQGSFPSIGQPNAQAAAGPYFQAKGTLFEGGIRVPAVIKTPAGSGEDGHRIVDTFAHITDLFRPLPTPEDVVRWATCW